MCKPMLVTVPFVLLLLDYWPLGRMTGDKWQVTGEKKGKPSTLLLEKVPLFGLAVAVCVATLFTQKVAIQPFEQISLSMRMGNALISYEAYLGQMFWPSGLAVFYPFAVGGVGVSRVVQSLVVLAGISTGVFVLRQRPYLLTGWLWYLIMLVPVIGIVQVGAQARADRYTYLPQIGLYVLLTWAAADLCAGWRHRRVVLGGGATIILIALIFCARAQTSYWRTSESLWTHTLACTSDNLIAHNNLGNALFKKGNVNEAIAHYQKALQIKPDDVEALNNLGIALAKTHGDYANKLVGMGRDDEAIVEFKEALELFPDYADARHDLAIILLHKGQVDEAIAQFREIQEKYPDDAMASFDLGNAYFQKGQMDEAVAFYQRALKIKPDDVSARNNLGMAFLRKGMVDEAVIQFREVLVIQPDFTLARTNLNKALGVGTEQDRIKAR
jgi:Flp pilus assembly protein TadD